VILHGKPVRYRVPAPAVRAGIAYVTEDRKVEGFFETMSVAPQHLSRLLAKVPGGRFFLSRARPTRSARLGQELQCGAPPGNDMKVVELSGGKPAEGGDCQIAGAGSGPDQFSMSRRGASMSVRSSRSTS